MKKIPHFIKNKVRTTHERRVWRKYIRRISKAKRTKQSQKSYCIMAFEDFHYNVVADFIKLCNPIENHVEVYTTGVCVENLEKSLGDICESVIFAVCDGKLDSVRADIMWPQNNGLATTSIAEVAANKGNYDKVILVSPEYYPDWYETMSTEEHNYELIMTMHNLNYILCPNSNLAKQANSFFSKADAFAVIDESLVGGILKRDDSKKNIYVLPPVFSDAEISEKVCELDRVCFTITGSVEAKRKNFDMVLDALEMCPDILAKVKLMLLGKAKGDYADRIICRLRYLEKGGLETIIFTEFVGEGTFKEKMEKTDVIIAPTINQTDFRGNDEYYGETKVSGSVGDIIKFAKPALVSCGAVMPKDFDSSVEIFKSARELATLIKKSCDSEYIVERKRKAIENSRKYSMKNSLYRIERPYLRRTHINLKFRLKKKTRRKTAKFQ